MELPAFLTCSIEDVRTHAPRTLVWAPGGTRRHAALLGVPAADYPTWAWEQHMAIVEQFFALGVTTLFTPILGPPQVREIGPYRNRLTQMISMIDSAASRTRYAAMGARVRCYGQQHLPEVADLCAGLERATAAAGPQTLWYSMAVTHEQESLEDALRAALAAGAQTIPEAVRAFYGEDVAPVDIFIGFGKLQVGYLMPPLLGEQADLYWTTFPSYMLDAQHIRIIFWDHRFGRATWTADKTNRYDQLEDILRAQYARRQILGVGKRIGRFWHQADG